MDKPAFLAWVAAKRWIRSKPLPMSLNSRWSQSLLLPQPMLLAAPFQSIYSDSGVFTR